MANIFQKENWEEGGKDKELRSERELKELRQ